MPEERMTPSGPIEHDAEDLDIMTRTVWGEARGEGREGWAAVAWVIRNRAARQPPAWWGRRIGEVCRKPAQFSCWNPGDPNASKLQAIEPCDSLYLGIRTVCEAVLAGRIADPTGGADHYEVLGTGARWAQGREPSAMIGQHAFYVLGPDA